MEKKLSFGNKLAYGLGNVAVMVAKQAPKRLCFPIYNIALGVNAAWIGALFSIMRIWDAITDPLIGHISDNYSSKYGRRKPFIVLGAILTGLFFAAIWMLPRGLSPVGYIVYLSVTVLLFYTALTIFSVPWYAMGYELTDNYDERTKLFAFPSFFSPISQIGVAWLYFLTQRSIFEDTIEGARYVGAFTGFLLIIFGLIPALFVNEKEAVVERKLPEEKKAKASFLRNLKESLSCKPFLIISISISGILMASAIVGSLHYYINIYYIYGGDKAAASTTIGWYWTTVYGVAALVVPLISKLGQRFGKRAIFQASLFWGVGVMIARWFLFTPDYPYLQLVDGLMYAILDAAVFLLCQAMIADVCDYDESKFGIRREGVFAAVYGWMFKTGLALGALVSGIILARIGFDKKIDQIPSLETLESMRFIYSFIPGFVFLAAGLLFFFYPLTKKEMLKIASKRE
ncbi:MAG: MFS transporter [Opitutales bacterium]|nr:MFS transporter [Opitutales bacterium]